MMNMVSRVRVTALACGLMVSASSLAVQAADAEKKEEKGAGAQERISLDTVIAKVNGKTVRMMDLARLVQELPPQIQQIPMDKLFPRLQAQLVDQLLIREAAKKQKLGETEEVKRLVAEATDRALVQAYMMKVVRERVNDPALKAAYETYKKDFKSEKEVKARHILVKDEEAANQIIADLKKGGDFAKLAAEKSTDSSTAKDGGDLGFFKKGDMVAAFSDVAFNLKPGSTTETPVKTEFGYHVIRVEESRDSSVESFDRKKAELGNALSQEAVVKALENLRTGAKVELFDEKGHPLSKAEGADRKDSGPRASKS